MEETTIYIHEVLILEPVTSLTDLLVSVLCFFAFFSLIRKKDSALHFKLIQWFFLTMGFATLSGGLIGHAFLYAFSFGWKLPGWLLSMLSISLLERASIEYAKPLLPKKLRRFMDWANIVELIIFMSLTFSFLNFRFVEVHSAFGLLAVNTPTYTFTLKPKIKPVNLC